MKVGDLVQLLNYGRQPMLRIGIVAGFKKELVKVDWTVGMTNQPHAFWEQKLLEVISASR